MNQKAFSKLICFTKLLQNKKKTKIQRLSHKMIAKRATVRENFFTQKKNAKLSNEDAENRPLITNNIEFDFCAKYKLDRVYWDISVGRIITVTSCSRDKLSRCLFWTKIVIQPPLEECIQCGEYYLPAESTLMYSCLKYYISTQNK